MKAGAASYTIHTLSKALDLLEQFQEDDADLAIADLSRRLNIKNNNLSLLVATLEAKDYLEQVDSSRKYRLGIKTRLLGQVATDQFDYAIYVRPYLSTLKQQSHETCYFSVIKDVYSHFLVCEESDLPVRVVPRIGYSRPLYCSATGKVQLAFMGQQKQMELLTGSVIKGLADCSHSELEKLHDELNLVAQKGYAIDNLEHDATVIEIAAPVFGSQGAIIGAISIVGPAMRLSDIRIESELLPLLKQCASRLSSLLGSCRSKEALKKLVRHSNQCVTLFFNN
jgi:DNA-binding IclR family transcriptional regulator